MANLRNGKYSEILRHPCVDLRLYRRKCDVPAIRRDGHRAKETRVVPKKALPSVEIHAKHIAPAILCQRTHDKAVSSRPADICQQAADVDVDLLQALPRTGIQDIDPPGVRIVEPDDSDP